MISGEKQGISFYQSEKLLLAGVQNYFLTRKGGFSRGELAKLNLSFRVGDDPLLVRKNYALVKEAFGVKTLVTVNQVHGAAVLDLDRQNMDEERLREIEADAIITRRKGVALAVLVADCLPLMLAEPKQGILALAHCGRRPILKGVIENSVRAIVERGGKVKRLIAALGPGVGPECYQVDYAVITEYRGRFPGGEGLVWRKAGAKYQLDLREAALAALRESGLEDNQIDDLKLCTCCMEEFFSHRRQRGMAGRQMALAMLK